MVSLNPQSSSRTISYDDLNAKVPFRGSSLAFYLFRNGVNVKGFPERRRKNGAPVRSEIAHVK